MNKTYEAPKLIVYGTVEQITQVIGSSTARDTLSIGGQVIPGTDGSGDIVR